MKIFYGIINFVVRLVGQEVKTPPSHGGNTGSSPVRAVLIKRKKQGFEDFISNPCFL